MNFDDRRRRADAVRGIPLSHVLRCWGAVHDRRDKRQWRTAIGSLTVTGAKFMNWHQQEGGGGAIDLVMHLGQMTYLEAVAWLEEHFDGHAVALSIGRHFSSPDLPGQQAEPRKLKLPLANLAQLEPVRRYLTEKRCLDPRILEPLLSSGKIYADQRANAVFLMVAGKANHPVGAELRGTKQQVWRGMAAGSRKDSGYFWVGVNNEAKIVLCESAIDAISCFQLRRDCICISTAGIRASPKWLRKLIERAFTIYCGFDADSAGDQAAQAMIRHHPAIQRLRPPANDWNDVLRIR